MRRLAPRRSFFAGRYRVALARRAAEGTLRSTAVRSETLIDFASNDYLGVARDSAFAAAHFAALDGTPTGLTCYGWLCV